ncbi:substrate of the Dot/Icm secretion system, LepB-like [Legionella lansingensis]|uniref:Effector protein B, substrate of the Dot/Icm secretion system n=1 Tax=Legionella lansingensis TaxID=45067 RepID=A0A0W0VUK7_9GAMM|nr:hypothetical protein [Legionella lansingensis]KTD23804.1 hypothetical protein Llan_0585 [Legionella lansingensis]SNV46951.1 substrate of the Dot/Icm secretion system, LepB-like [Legionella lansingensis]
MLIYKGKELKKFQDKVGGKNKHEVDGFYRTSDGEEYFIKKPQDPKELFAELFAGFLLEEFKRRGLIPKIYHNSFVCADVIPLEDGSYGLIQPKIKFTELHKIIGTGNRNGSDRSPFWEMLFGPDHYLLLTKLENYFGLSMVLMFSLLIGDYSVHSGNVVHLEPQEGAIQFARIDLGAAFRNFGYPENNENLFHPKEYQGLFNIAGFTKGYFSNYRKITGLFSAIAGKAKALIPVVDDELLKEIVSTVLKKMPANLIDDRTREDLSVYLGIPSFCKVGLGSNLNHEPFCTDFVNVLTLRLAKLAKLRDLSPKQNNLYRSISSENLTQYMDLSVHTDLPFPDQLDIWLQGLGHCQGDFFDKINLAELIKQFHFFKDVLIKQAELLDHQTSLLNKENNHAEAINESELLHQLFTLNTDGTPAFNGPLSRSMQKPIATHWNDVEKVLAVSFNVIVTIRVAQETEDTSIEHAKEYAFKTLLSALKEHLTTFHEVYKSLMKQFDVLSHSSSTTRPKNKKQQKIEESKISAHIPLTDKIDNQSSELVVARGILQEQISLLQERMKQDIMLKDALLNTKKMQLSSTLIRDLLALKEFYDKKIALNTDDGLGRDYNHSLDKFYRQMLHTRLSETPLRTQAKLMLKFAYQEFETSHDKAVLLADALRMIGILFDGLGLVAGLGHKAFDKNFFFNSALTPREPEPSQVRVVNKESLLDPIKKPM